MTRAAVLSFIALCTLLANPRTALAGVAGPYPSFGYMVAAAFGIVAVAGALAYVRYRRKS
jgi:hypothetical protein